MTDAVYAELDRLLTARDRDDMAPTLAALKVIYDEHPTDARVLYEYAGAHDTAGQGQAAAELYEQALAAGLEGDVRRRCLLQYGSTLRNLGRFDASIALFTAARDEVPDAASLAVFEAITLHAAGHVHAALGSLLDVIASYVDSPELERYKPAIRGNAAYLRDLDAGESAG